MLRAFQWDLARQVERLDHLLALLPRYAAWGYQRLYLHLEDAVDYPGLPGLARADAYPWADLQKLVATASAHGIHTVPIANLLGHTQYVIKNPAWRDLNERRDPLTGTALPTGQICPLHPRTADLAARLFADLAPLCTAGEIHVGLDESFLLGQHPLSRAEIAAIGLPAHFARYVTRLHALAANHQLRLGLWADMLALLPAALPLLPTGLSLYDWYYHPFARYPRMELYNFSEYDLPGQLDPRAGHHHWACPMNGAFRWESAPVWTDRLQNLAAWWRRAHATAATGYLVTSWEPHRLALPATTLLSAAAATLWLEPARSDDPASLLTAGLRRAHGLGRVAASRIARALLASDAQAFVGQSRWEILRDWAPVAGRRESPLPHARAARQFSRLASTLERPNELPPHELGYLAATARFQAYLARREAFVRGCGGLIARLRRRHARGLALAALLAAAQAEASAFGLELRPARRAARALWCSSRPAASFAASPNAAALRIDAQRLRIWLNWLRRVSRRPAHAHTAAPGLAGRWTLRFTVHHFAPTHQKIVVEQFSAADGLWHERHQRVLIEFRAAAARPSAPELRFEFACPIADPAAPLRIAARCLGPFAVSHIELTDGIATRQHGALRTRHVLGQPAPREGFPVLDWQTNTGCLPLDFSASPGPASAH